METLWLSFASAAFLLVGGSMVLYELSLIKAKKLLMNGHPAVDFYYVGYLTMFLLSFVTAIKAAVG
jgi:hypothetical protein